MKKVLSFPPSREHILDSQLRFAIAHKRLIQFTYESAVRVAEPHDYGVRDGAPKLLAYQRQKAGQRDERVRGWRWLEISKVEQCLVLDDSFRGRRETAGQQHHRWDIVFARVDEPT